MENVQRVTAHLTAKLRGEGDISRRLLTLLPARDGTAYYRDGAGNYWRSYIFIEKARTYDAIHTPGQAFQAARAFGQFQTQLGDLPAPRLHETIPDFHHTPRRFARFEQVLAADPANRVPCDQRAARAVSLLAAPPRRGTSIGTCLRYSL